MKITGTKNAKTIHGPTEVSNFSFSVTPRTDIISGSSNGQVTIKDVIYDQSIAALTDIAANISVIQDPGQFNTVTYTSLDPTIATVDSSGKVTRVSDGVARINISTAPHMTRQVSITVSRQGGQTVNIFNSYAAGSLAKHITDGINNAIAGKAAQASSDIAVFSTDDKVTPVYVYNVNNFLSGLVDLTPISPWNSYMNSPARGGVLISPRHFAYANHFSPATPIGTIFRFIKSDGTVVTRTLVAQAEVSLSDIGIAVLDSDVPSGIGFCKILPSNAFTSYMPSLTSSIVVPAIGCLGGDFSGIVTTRTTTVRDTKDITNFTSGGQIYYNIVFQKSLDPTRAAFYDSDVIIGDSGNPAFFMINGQLVLESCWTGGGGGVGPDYSGFVDRINTTITALGSNPSNYQVTTIDLSAFNTY